MNIPRSIIFIFSPISVVANKYNVNSKAYGLEFTKKATKHASIYILPFLNTVIILYTCFTIYSQMVSIMSFFNMSNSFIIMGLMVFLIKNSNYYNLFILKIENIVKKYSYFLYECIPSKWQNDLIKILIEIYDAYPLSSRFIYNLGIVFITVTLFSSNIIALIHFVFIIVMLIVLIHISYINTHIRCNYRFLFYLLFFCLSVLFVYTSVSYIECLFGLSGIQWIRAPFTGPSYGNSSSGNSSNNPRGPNNNNILKNALKRSRSSDDSDSEEREKNADFCQHRVRLLQNKDQTKAEREIHEDWLKGCDGIDEDLIKTQKKDKNGELIYTKEGKPKFNYRQPEQYSEYLRDAKMYKDSQYVDSDSHEVIRDRYKSVGEVYFNGKDRILPRPIFMYPNFKLNPNSYLSSHHYPNRNSYLSSRHYPNCYPNFR